MKLMPQMFNEVEWNVNYDCSIHDIVSCDNDTRVLPVFSVVQYVVLIT